MMKTIIKENGVTFKELEKNIYARLLSSKFFSDTEQTFDFALYFYIIF